MKKIILVCISIVCLYCIACKEKNIEPYYLNLNNKPLDTIKKYIEGKWQMHYSIGGIAGNYRTNYINTFVEFTISPINNDSLNWYNDTFVFINNKVIFNKVPKYSNNTDSVYEISEVLWVMNQIKNDTLTIFENTSESAGYFLTRIK